MVSAPHSDLALLTTLLERGLPAEIPASELSAWFNQPHIQSALASLKSLADSAAALRQARARFTAIDTLDQLCQSDPNPTARLRAAIALLRPPSLRKDSAPSSQADPAGVQASSRGHSEESPTSAAHGPSNANLHDPEGVQASSRGQSEESSTSAAHGLARENHTDPQGVEVAPTTADTTPNPETPHSLLDLLQTLEDPDLDADLDTDFDDAEDQGAAQDAADDEAADRHAAAIEAHLGVPITHPEILKAISELRIHDLDAIAAKIRAESNSSISPDPRATGPGQEARAQLPPPNLNGHSRSPPG